MGARLILETTLADRRGALLALAGKDATPSGANPVYDDALAEGLAALDLRPAGPAPADADFVAVDPGQWPELRDVAELRLLRSIIGNLARPNQQISMGRRDFGSLRDGVMKEMADLEERLKALYGYGLPAVTAARVDLNFAQTDPCATEILRWN